ncbi:MAG: dethiobiotin synthase [Leptospiraceae bacterium]|nr:dethiobiotin synthase [Leptospiraceae bacterium]MCK6380676.1 dethiobiotin synthase [Leptospiraceae bacterium]NUM42080.1 dethiobiotin synthase [Leptospiraceae bacterium]
MSFFVTATGTDVGKTIFSAFVIAKFKKKYNIKYWKPIQTGMDIDSQKIHSLTGLESDNIKPSLYHFYYPASPHYSAYFEMETIDTGLVIDELKKIQNLNYVIEGAGGVLVPINEDKLQIDIFSEVKIPVVVVSSSELGTINHTLLTIEALKKREMNILGFYIYGKNNELVENNIATIEKFSKIPFLGKTFLPEDIRDTDSFIQFTDKDFDKEKILEKALFP